MIFRAVIDTNVIFEGLTKQGGTCGLIVDAWLAALFLPCLSNSLASEYADALSRKLSDARWRKLKPVLGMMLDSAIFVPIYFSWRPTSPDLGDEHVIDCAMNAIAPVITSNLRDFRPAQQTLGLEVISPVVFVSQLARESRHK